MEEKNSKKKEDITTLDELAGIMLKAFDSNQQYMDEKFGAIDKKFEQVARNFKQINDKIDNISKNTFDVVHQEDFDKLENRITHVETVIGIDKNTAIN